MKATTEQRLQYGQGMSPQAMPPPHPLPTGPFLSGFLVQLFKERRRELSRMKLWGFLATVTFPCKVNNKLLMNEQTPQSPLLVT